MGREVRMVPADWEHPSEMAMDQYGEIKKRYKPLYVGHHYQATVDEWDEECAKWKNGWRPDYCTDPEDKALSYEQWAGQRPHKDDYMPDWPDEQLTHLMMYENTSEGTPISPAFGTPEELAQWLVDNNASVFGSETGSYEGWLELAKAMSDGFNWQEESKDAAEDCGWVDIKEVLSVLNDSLAGKWNWYENSANKYLNLRLDMRNGMCVMYNRFGEEITLQNLKKQEQEK